MTHARAGAGPGYAVSLALLGAALGCATPAPQPMSQERLEALIGASAGGVEDGGGMLRFVYGGVAMACVSDVAHDRMRIVAPIVEAGRVSPEVLTILMTANFHTTLDGRYAMSEGVVYAVYLHPLSSLGPTQLESALRQVASLARTFGTSFSSGELNFGATPGEAL